MHELEHRAGLPRQNTCKRSNISPVQKLKQKIAGDSGGTSHEQSRHDTYCRRRQCKIKTVGQPQILESTPIRTLRNRTLSSTGCAALQKSNLPYVFPLAVGCLSVWCPMLRQSRRQQAGLLVVASNGASSIYSTPVFKPVNF